MAKEASSDLQTALSGSPALMEIRSRLTKLGRQRANYLAYQQDRVDEYDHHGAWDVAINLSETECEMAGLQFALDALEGK